MSYCLNPNCQNPKNPDGINFCLTCGTKLLLKDRYRAADFLGAGGMGRNFLAVDEDTPSKKRCVIKQFCPDLDIQRNTTAFHKAIELFNREAAQLDQLGDESPQIPRLLAHIEQDKRLYFVQEFIDGQNLLQELKQRLTYQEAQIYQLLNDLLPVLKFIHDRGVIHRDIKPENIMRRSPQAPLNKGGRGDLVLIDFGISKQLSGTVMSMGTTVGTLGYAPPEQMTYGEAYPASDRYALGATCIHLLTDMEPHQLYNPMENRWLWRDVLASRGVVVSQQLGQILDKMLSADVRERWRSVDELQAILTVKTLNYASLPCSCTLDGHSNFVNSVTFNPDGKTLASGSKDKIIKLWNVCTGRQIRTLKGHSNWVRSVAFSPDGKTLASGGHDKTIKLWDVYTGREISTLKSHSNWVRSVAFSPDGKILASGSEDKTIKLWDISTRQEISTLKGHSKGLYFVAFSPDGKQIASGSGDKTIKLWDISTRQEISTLKGHSGMVRSVAFSPDGKTLASGSWDDTIKLWNVSTLREINTLNGHSNHVFCVAFSPDGKTLASSSWDNRIKLWDVSTGREIITLKGHLDYVLSVAFSPNGKTLASGSNDETIKIWQCDYKAFM